MKGSLLLLSLLFCSSLAFSLNETVDSSSEISGDSFLQLARRYWVASLASYCPDRGIQGWTCYWCKTQGLKMNVTHVIHNQDILAYAGYNNNEIVLSFRGTIGPQNWLTDLNIILVSPWNNKIGGALIHQGFYQAYLLIQQQVRNAAIELARRFPNKKIVVTGHSLGAGLATVATADLLFQPLPVKNIQLWTYGSPRCGNPAFAKFMDSKLMSYRIVNKGDNIPALPPQEIGYRHINREYWFHSPTTFTTCQAYFGGEDLRCSDSLGIRRNPPDHDGYMGLIKTGCPF